MTSETKADVKDLQTSDRSALRTELERNSQCKDEVTE